MEEWREVFRWLPDDMTETTEAVIVISNIGRVKRKPYRRWNVKNGSYSNIKEKEYAYLTNRGKQRYEDFNVKNGKYTHVDINGRAYSVHRLVAMAFLPNPKNLPQVHHKDENRSNNHVSNLEWVTNKENQEKRSDKSKLKKIKKLMRFSEAQAKEALIMRLKGVPYLKIAKIYNISYETMRSRTNEIATDEEKEQIRLTSLEKGVKRRLDTLRQRGIIK